MNITVTKLTGIDLLRDACDSTRKRGMSPSAMTLEKAYRCEHSPARTQMFWVKMKGIPSFVSVHLVRHKIGVDHFVESNRDDRGGDDSPDRLTPINHSMIVNAQALINMAHDRLCYASHHTTVGVFMRLRSAVERVDPELACEMYPKCVLRGYCPEIRQCKAGVVAVLRAHNNTHPVVQRRKIAALLTEQLV